MRLVRTLVSADAVDEVEAMLDGYDVDHVVVREASDREDAVLVEFPVPTQAVETVLDDLREIGDGEDAYTVVASAESVFVPHVDELEARFVTGTEEDDAIATEEVRATALDLTPSPLTYYSMTTLSALVATAGILLDSAGNDGHRRVHRAPDGHSGREPQPAFPISGRHRTIKPAAPDPPTMTDAPEASDHFAALYRLASADGLTLENKIDRAIEVGCERLDVPNGVLSYTADGEYEVIQSTIDEGVYTPGGRSDLGRTWCRHVIENRELLSFANVEATPYADDVAVEATGLSCYIGAAVVVDNETYGTLCFSGEDPRENEFTDIERRFVRLLAQWVSYELERDRHHRELREQNERLDEFVGIVAHDLRNPLGTVQGYTDLALESAEGTQADHLRRIERAADRMERLVDDLLRLARDGGDVGERVPVDVAGVARDAWSFFEDGEATLEVRSDATVYANRSRLQQLFENLFRNAVEHCGPTVTVTVSDTDGGFAVEDDGTGLPSEIEATLFTPSFDRTAGLGLGLLIVERVVSGHEWDGSVHSDPDGTTFTFDGVERVGERQVTPENG